MVKGLAFFRHATMSGLMRKDLLKDATLDISSPPDKQLKKGETSPSKESSKKTDTSPRKKRLPRHTMPKTLGLYKE